MTAFGGAEPAARGQIVRLHVDRVRLVRLRRVRVFDYRGERPVARQLGARQGRGRPARPTRREKNAVSIDGLPTNS